MIGSLRPKVWNGISLTFLGSVPRFNLDKSFKSRLAMKDLFEVCDAKQAGLEASAIEFWLKSSRLCRWIVQGDASFCRVSHSSLSLADLGRGHAAGASNLNLQPLG